MYLFLISPNNSGKSVISQYIAQRFDFYLPPFTNNEGQFAPEVAPIMRDRPWDETRQFDWRFIKSIWDGLLRASGRSVFLEASPPNMLRVSAIREAFGAEARFIYSISDPYSYCGSCMYRYKTQDNPATIETLVSGWLFRARRQRQNIEAFPDVPKISYESFCSSPETVDRAVSRLLPGRRPVDHTLSFIGKAAGYGGIVNLNARNIAFFEYPEVETISTSLAREPDLLQFFGYVLLTRGRYEEIREKAPHLWEAGRSRRMQWSQLDLSPS